MMIYKFTCAYFGFYVFACALLGAALGAAISPWMTWMGSRNGNKEGRGDIWQRWDAMTDEEKKAEVRKAEKILRGDK